MTENEVIDFCLTLDGAFKRYPFPNKKANDPGPLIMSVKETKMFCVVNEGSDPLHIILKCDPMEADFLRAAYPSIKPGYHFNKQHWNSVYIDGTVPDEDILRMIRNSYELVNGNSKRR